jgi:fumarate reductase flavoprotein subunit
MEKRLLLSVRTGVILMVLMLLSLTAWQGSSYGGAEEKIFLADRHQMKGIACASCHKENPPKAAVPTAVCIDCHGAYATIAGKTKKIEPNPHASHLEELSCESCHHAHKSPENHCLSCHSFEFKVP